MKKESVCALLFDVTIGCLLLAASQCHAQAPNWQWAHNAAGDVYITGLYEPPGITFDNVTLTNAGGSDIFIAKYSSTGNVLWVRNSGGPADEQSLGMFVENAGNAYVTGRFKSASVAFGSSTLTNVGGEDIFVTKYDASGNVIWATSVGGTSDDNGNSIC